MERYFTRIRKTLKCLAAGNAALSQEVTVAFSFINELTADQKPCRRRQALESSVVACVLSGYFSGNKELDLCSTDHIF